MTESKIVVHVDIRLRAEVERELPDWLVEELSAAGVDLADSDAIGDALEKRLHRYGDYDTDSIAFPFEYYEGLIELDDVEIDDVRVLPVEVNP